jgi:hypothetical protein
MHPLAKQEARKRLHLIVPMSSAAPPHYGKRLIITPLASERSGRGRLAKVQARALRRHAETFRKLAR